MLMMHRVSWGRWHVPPMCLHTTAVHTKKRTRKVRIPLHGTLFCIKPSHGIPPGLPLRSDLHRRTVWCHHDSPRPPNKNTAGCMRSRRLTCEGGWRAFRVLYFYLGDLTLETSSPDNNVISAGFKQQTLYSSSFDTWVWFLKSQSGFLSGDLLVELELLLFFLLEKKWENKHKKTTELHWCQLIYMCSF